MGSKKQTLLILTTVLSTFQGSQAQCNSAGPGHFLQLVSQSVPQPITSPGYNTNGTYQNNTDCRWMLRAPISVERICLRVVGLFIEFNNISCHAYDYLEIFDGAEIPQNRMVQICGEHPPGSDLCSGSINTQDAGDYLTVHFHTDASGTKRGFHLEFWTQFYNGSLPPTTAAPVSTVTAGHGSHGQCNSYGLAVQLTSSMHPQNISSPGYYNDAYPNGADCWWKLRSPDSGQRVCVDVLDLDTEGTSPLCSRADYLEVFDGAAVPPNLLAELCGDNPSVGQLCSGTSNNSDTSDFLIIHFHTDDSFYKRGFFLQFQSQAPVITTTTATPIDIPYYCSGYPNYLELHSTLAPQQVASPGYYDGTYANNLRCQWMLKAPTATARVCMRILDLSIEGRQSNCDSADYLHIFNSADTSHSMLAELCDTVHDGLEVCSTVGHYLLLDFHTDSSIQRRGFLLQFWTQSASPADATTPIPPTTSSRCDPRQTVEITSTTMPQNFTSPGYENGAYPYNADCFWKLSAPFVGDEVCIKILDIDIEDDLIDCTRADYLQVYNGAAVTQHLLARLCGDHLPDRVLCSSPGDFLILHFRSDYTINRRGFLLQYWTRTIISSTTTTTTIARPTTSHPQCYNPVIQLTSSEQSQLVASPGYYNGSYPNSLDCHWRVQAAVAGERVCMQIFDLDLEGGGNNCHRADYLNIYDGAEVPIHLVAQLCGSSSDVSQICSGLTATGLDAGDLLTLYLHTDASFSRRGFLARFWMTSHDPPNLPAGAQAAWTVNSPPDGLVINNCVGSTITFTWGYVKPVDIEVSDITWLFQGQSQEMVALETHGQFVALPAYSNRVEAVGTAGIRLRNVTVADAGTYSVELQFFRPSDRSYVTLRRTAVLHIGVPGTNACGSVNAGA